LNKYFKQLLGTPSTVSVESCGSIKVIGHEIPSENVLKFILQKQKKIKVNNNLAEQYKNNIDEKLERNKFIIKI